jgi:hypothetical protein
VSLPTPILSLRGKRVFLSASIPAKERAARFRRIPDASVFITEAVIALARAVLSHGGTLVMGAHPTISPLVMQVAAEYRPPAPREDEESSWKRSSEFVREMPEPQIVVYQSKVFEGRVPDETLFLGRMGYAKIAWTERVDKERFSKRKSAPIAPKSLELMRRQMIEETRPDAMVCAGGMEGTEEEARIFSELRSDRPIFVLESTGGAAAILEGKAGVTKVRVMDREFIHEIETLRRKHPLRREKTPFSLGSEVEQERAEEPPELLPDDVLYPLIMQTIVDDLGSH